MTHVRSNAVGEFNFHVPAAGVYRLMAQRPGVGFASVDVQVEADGAICRLNLEPGSSVLGQVFGLNRPNPIACVRATQVKGGEDSTTFTDEQGKFQFSDLPAGGYVFSAHDPNKELDMDLVRAALQTGTFPGIGPSKPTHVRVNLESGGSTHVNLSMPINDKVAVRVELIDVQAAREPHVLRVLKFSKFDRRNRGQPVAQQTIHDAGTIDLESDLEPGSYMFAAIRSRDGIVVAWRFADVESPEAHVALSATLAKLIVTGSNRAPTLRGLRPNHTGGGVNIGLQPPSHLGGDRWQFDEIPYGNYVVNDKHVQVDRPVVTVP